MTTNQQASSRSPWLRLLFLFLVGGAIVSVVALLPSEDTVGVVEDQLKALRNHSVSKAYYEYTSKEFQQTTTLPQFREFLSIYPVLYDNFSYHLEGASPEDGRAEVTGVLVSKGMEEMRADWILVKEGDEWKVVSLRLTELEKSDDDSQITGQMIDFAKKQLQSLRDQDFVEAYYGFVSKDFQKETSKEEFEAFVRENPILFNYRTIEPEEGRVENDRGYVTLSLENGKGPYQINYVLSREMGEWKVFSLKVVLPPEVAIQKAATNPEALIPPVREILDTLASDNIYRAYQQTSKEFQDSTSFDHFEEFIGTFPAFTDREMADIRRGEVQNGTGTVRVNLHDDGGITEVDFRMGYSEGEWLIWGMEVVDSPVKPKQKSYNTVFEEESPRLADQLLTILEQQMAYLHRQDFYEVYELMMSDDYRSENSLEDFKEFLVANSVFMDHRNSYFNRLLEKDGAVELRGVVTTFEDETYPVRFDFKNEDGNWKIDGMHLLEAYEPIAEAEEVLDKPEKDLPPKPLEFTSIVLGTKVDQQGRVVSPVEELEGDTDLLFFNIHLDNGQPKTLITLYLEHVDSGTSAPPLTTMLDKEGKSAISFSYAAPQNGWPPGDYIAKVSASTGPEKLFKFKVKENKK